MDQEETPVVQRPGSAKSHETPLGAKIAKWTSGKNRVDTTIQGLSLHRWSAPTEPTSYMLPPSICLIGQGRKRLVLGEETFEYDAHSFVITSVDLPVVAQIIEASEEAPYLGLTLELDLRVVGELMLSRELPPRQPSKDRLGITVGGVASSLFDAFERLLDLLEQPDDIPVLAPLIKREIFYRLLMNEQGARLRQICSLETRSYQVSRAIDWLKENYDKPCRTEELAEKAGLSVSAFHSHFRSMTAMSPLQFQKRMRLNEARRLMLMDHLDASAAAFQVGYESPSQFSREYSRLFGAPPLRDIRGLGQSTAN